MAVCLSPGCAVAAVELIRDMSPNYQTVDPCTNFRDYVCEGFDRTHDLRSDQDRLGTMGIMSENADLILHQILESPVSELPLTVDSPAAKANFEKMHDAYGACMNESLLTEKGDGPLLSLLAHLDLLFPRNAESDEIHVAVKGRDQAPMAETPRDTKKDEGLTDKLQLFIDLDISALISLGVGTDDKDPDKQTVFLAGTDLGLISKRFYKQENLLTLYRETVAKIFDQLSISKDLKRSAAHDQRALKEYNVSAIIEFESKIAEAKANPEELNDPEKRYNLMNLTEIDKSLPQINVSSLIEKHAPGLGTTSVVVSEPEYLAKLSKLLQATSTETIQGYLIWNVILRYGTYVISDTSKSLNAFSNVLAGKDPDAKKERWRTCVRHIDSSYESNSGLGWILSSYYINETFSANSTAFGNRVIADIKSRFISKIHSAKWMTPSVRDLAIDKVRAIRQKIGYPTASPDVTSPEDLQKYYHSLNVSSNDLFANAISFASFDVAKNWAQAGKPTNRDTWSMTSPTINAYYSPSKGEIVFPAGIMQRPVFYNPSIPRYLSYGAFGAVAGHELSHAFDSAGSKYDVDGKLRQWWDENTLAAFKNKTECFVGQYDEYTVPDPDGKEVHVNGKLTQGENIADAGGVSASFQAWKEAERQSGEPDELLPGLLDFSKEQLFFISYANVWCEKARPATVVRQVLTDPHSPTGVRIMGTMANSREFREAFNCPVKEPTCELW